MSILKVSPKGAVVIPTKIRSKYGIKPGMRVAISEMESGIQIMPIPDDPVTMGRGLLKKQAGKSLTDILLAERKRDLQKEEAKAQKKLEGEV